MTLYISISIVIVYFTGLPWVLAMPYIIGLPVGCILLGFGLTFIICAYLKLSIKRAFGSEIYEPKSKSMFFYTSVNIHFDIIDNIYGASLFYSQMGRKGIGKKIW